MENKNQPAFPTDRVGDGTIVTTGEVGLTKREYLAALIASASTDQPDTFPMSQKATDKSHEDWAIRVIRKTDTLLKQLEK